MTAAITRVEPADEAIELALVEGDLSRLTSAQRRSYYLHVCESVGLNPLTKPFEYLRLNGKMILYATKACTDQLRATRGVSIDIVKRVVDHGVCEVTAQATMDGRKDTDVGAVYVESLKGEALANAVMKAHTKAKRRVTLSICGLSLLDESEIDSVRGAERVEEPAPPQLMPRHDLAPDPRPAPPALHNGGDNSALWSRFSAEVSQAPDLASLKALGATIKQAADAQKLTLTQVAQLRDLVKARQKVIKAPVPVEVALAGNDLPASWGGPEEPQPREETCVVCSKPLGGAACVETETRDGEVGMRHMTCEVPFDPDRDAP